MTDTEPQAANPFETDEYAQYVADCITARERCKAELTGAITRAKAALADIRTLEDELSTEEYLDVADGDDWLGGDDLGAFNALLENAAVSLAAAAAINRPHPGTPLWPQTVPHTAQRTEYAVQCTVPMDVLKDCTGLDQLPKRYVGGFDTEFLAQRKAVELLANGHVLTAEVKMRKHSASSWGAPAPQDDDE